MRANGSVAAAEIVYGADLRVNPENGWALSGLARSLELQGKKAEAKAISGRARVAWKSADIALAWLGGKDADAVVRVDAPRVVRRP